MVLILLRNQNLAGKYPFLNNYTSPVKKSERPIVGRQEEMNRILATFMNPELCNVILLAEAGSGKALANDTLIPVADKRGYVRICDLKVGDIVFDEKGNPTKVMGVYPQGKKLGYRMVFKDNSDIICCDEHLWNVRSRYGHNFNKEFNTKALKEILKKEDLSEIGMHQTLYIPMNHALNRKTYNYGVHPYIIGVFLNNNCLTNKNEDLSIPMSRKAVVEKVANLLGADNFINSYGKYKFIKDGRILKVNYLNQLEDLQGLVGFDTNNRSLPSQYLLGSIAQRYELVNGFMDVYGRVRINNSVACSAYVRSEKMANDLKSLFTSLGIRCSTSYVGVLCRYELRVSMSDDKKTKLFTLDKHRSNIKDYLLDTTKKHNFRYNDISIKSIENTGKEYEMTCIRVNSESSLFQATKNHIVTHNTMLVQGTMAKDKNREYVEVDLARMITELNDINEMATRLKTLFDEAAAFTKNEGKELVLFIDEFHQIVQLSPAAVEALKPLLADSGTRGIRVVAATTYIEFRQFIQPNQPLVERLKRINLQQPDKDMTVEILKGMSKRYGVDKKIIGSKLYELIYEYTNRYIPANSQPRKSILVLDSMVGWHRLTGEPLGLDLLGKVLQETEGVNISFKVDARSIKSRLTKRVYNQDLAASVIEKRLQVCVADINNKSKPMSSFLFTGSTGVGKTEMVKALADILFADERNLIRFDMSEFANPDSLNRFRTELTSRVWERPYSIILLDEIEKSCQEVTRLLLQVLDDGRLIDENNREISFLNSYIVLTTNAASEVYESVASYNVSDDGSGESMLKFRKLIEESIKTTTGDRFPPELLGRIDEIVPFQTIDEPTMKKIIQRKAKALIKEVLLKHTIQLRISDKVINYIVLDSLDTDPSSGGARNAIRKFDNEITAAVARAINEHPDSKRLGVLIDGELMSDNKYKLKSDARVIVGEIS